MTIRTISGKTAELPFKYNASSKRASDKSGSQMRVADVFAYLNQHVKDSKADALTSSRLIAGLSERLGNLKEEFKQLEEELAEAKEEGNRNWEIMTRRDQDLEACQAQIQDLTGTAERCETRAAEYARELNYTREIASRLDRAAKYKFYLGFYAGMASLGVLALLARYLHLA